MRMYAHLRCPSVADLKRIIKVNALKDCTMTVDGVILAQKICGPDEAYLMGNTVWHKPMPVIADILRFQGNSLQNKKKWNYVLTLSKSIICHSWKQYQEISNIKHEILYMAVFFWFKVERFFSKSDWPILENKMDWLLKSIPWQFWLIDWLTTGTVVINKML